MSLKLACHYQQCNSLGSSFLYSAKLTASAHCKPVKQPSLILHVAASPVSEDTINEYQAQDSSWDSRVQYLLCLETWLLGRVEWEEGSQHTIGNTEFMGNWIFQVLSYISHWLNWGTTGLLDLRINYICELYRMLSALVFITYCSDSQTWVYASFTFLFQFLNNF